MLDGMRNRDFSRLCFSFISRHLDYLARRDARGNKNKSRRREETRCRIWPGPDLTTWKLWPRLLLGRKKAEKIPGNLFPDFRILRFFGEVSTRRVERGRCRPVNRTRQEKLRSGLGSESPLFLSKERWRRRRRGDWWRWGGRRWCWCAGA